VLFCNYVDCSSLQIWDTLAAGLDPLLYIREHVSAAWEPYAGAPAPKI
jgi:hypothetical protein